MTGSTSDQKVRQQIAQVEISSISYNGVTWSSRQ